MARPLREEVPGGYYHVTTKGNGGGPIFLDDHDFAFHLAFVGRAVLRFAWRCYAFCLMTNHYHVVLQLTEPSLARGMKWLNKLYTQAFNQQHGRTGHVFGGRYRTTVIQDEEHLARACRYVDLNPVRAGLCSDPAEWPWSSYRALAGLAPVPPFLSAAAVIELVGGAGPEAYRDFVAEALVEEGSDPFTGSDPFLARH